VVLRPAGAPEEVAWTSQVLSTLPPSDEFTVPLPVSDDRGEWVHDGWHAMEWVPGAADETRVDDVIRAGSAFHRALSGLPKPAFIAASDHAWSRADRSAWEEAPVPRDELLDVCTAAFRPVASSSQVIHGDLLGNVLFADGRPPAVIDWAPYWRPPGFGVATAVIDAACWHGYPLGRLAVDFGFSDWRQLLLRALVFRMTTLQLLHSWSGGMGKRHARVAHAVLSLPDRSG
jgi:uncharacterized protein (TIGR02569 family)